MVSERGYIRTLCDIRNPVGFPLADNTAIINRFGALRLPASCLCRPLQKVCGTGGMQCSSIVRLSPAQLPPCLYAAVILEHELKEQDMKPTMVR